MTSSLIESVARERDWQSVKKLLISNPKHAEVTIVNQLDQSLVFHEPLLNLCLEDEETSILLLNLNCGGYILY